MLIKKHLCVFLQIFRRGGQRDGSEGCCPDEGQGQGRAQVEPVEHEADKVVLGTQRRATHERKSQTKSGKF